MLGGSPDAPPALPPQIVPDILLLKSLEPVPVRQIEIGIKALLGVIEMQFGGHPIHLRNRRWRPTERDGAGWSRYRWCAGAARAVGGGMTAVDYGGA